jgi:hypothetical protein
MVANSFAFLDYFAIQDAKNMDKIRSVSADLLSDPLLFERLAHGVARMVTQPSNLTKGVTLFSQ